MRYSCHTRNPLDLRGIASVMSRSKIETHVKIDPGAQDLAELCARSPRPQQPLVTHTGFRFQEAVTAVPKWTSSWTARSLRLLLITVIAKDPNVSCDCSKSKVFSGRGV